MKSCPNCGADLAEARKLVRMSARDLVEGLDLDADLIGSAARSLSIAGRLQNAASPAAVYNIARAFAETELDDFKLRMRANGYKVGRNLVKDARAAFQYHMRNSVKFSTGRKEAPKPVGRKQPAKKEL